MDKNKKRRFLPGPLIYILFMAVILIVVQALGDDTGFLQNKSQTLSYNELLTWVEEDLRADTDKTPTEHGIDAVIIRQQKLIGLKSDSTIEAKDFGTKYDFDCILPTEEQFYADVMRIYERVLGRTVSPAEFTFTVSNLPPKQPSWLEEWLPYIICFALLAVLWFFMMTRQNNGGKGMMNFGKAKPKINDPAANKVTFKDVAGAEEEKNELKELVDFLRDPQKYTRLGAKIPHGVLLVGPPGTGKTLLARAVAGEAQVPFFTISGSDFVEMFVGVGASRVRDLFDQVKRSAPAIIFIDEIDAVGRQRGAGLGGGHDEREQTLNQLLVEMDGFTKNQGVIVMAATNRSDILDPALLRPGRFDRRIVVNYPDIDGREEILMVHANGKPLAADVNLRTIARRTAYFTGADLMNVMNEAALLTARANKEEIDMAVIEEAITRVMAGPEKKSHRVTDADRKLVAYHEGGHAIVAHFIPECDKVHEITTIPRGQAGGYTMYLPDESFNYVTTARLRGQMASAMGGRVAEAVVFGDISTGASSDIKHATEIARSMVTEYGMSSKVGPIFLGSEHEVFLGKSFSQQNSSFSESMNTDIDQEVRRLLHEAYTRAESILTEHRDKLDGLAAYLLENEKMDGETFEAFMKDEPLPEE